MSNPAFASAHRLFCRTYSLLARLCSRLFPIVMLAQDAGFFAQCGNAPDMVIVNANIITMDPAQPTANTLLVRDGLVQAVGEESDLVYMIPEGCPVQWIDAEGLTLLPGFNDAHAHWLSWPEHICDASGQPVTTYPPLHEIMDTLARHGWTSMSELNFGRPDLIPEHLQNAIALEAAGDLHVRINGYWGTYDDPSMIQVLQSYGYEPGHAFSDRIRAPGVKCYVDDPFGTMDLLDQTTCTALVQAAHQAGYQVAAHCVNVSAVGKILNAYEAALGSGDNLAIRHRIEHVVKVTDSQFQRMANKGILASFQLMGPPDWPEQTTFQTYLSQDNTDYLLRWKDFVGSVIPVAGSTDAPFNNSVCDYSPFRAIYQAVTRQGYINRNHAQWELDQRITIADGLYLLTVGGAWATHEEDVKGSLSTGKNADFTIVTADPLAVGQPEDLLDISALLTVVGGQIEYCNASMSSFCTPAIAFRVDTMIVTVSGYLNGQEPANAFDLDDESNWGAGSHPPQYIQVDLLKDTPLDRIELVVDQFPAGFTRHQVFGATSGHSHEQILLHAFAGETASLQTLSYPFTAPNKTLRYVRVLTTESPSWVSWREIRIISATTSVNGQPRHPARIRLYPNPADASVHVDLSLLQPVGQLHLYVVSMDGRQSAAKYIGHLAAGEHDIAIEPQLLASMGAGEIILVIKGDGFSAVSRFIKP